MPQFSLSDWADVATIAAAVFTAAAAGVAFFAILHARKLHNEASQAYVAVTMEPNEHFMEMVELVVKNTGATAARDVRLSSSPELMRTGSPVPAQFRPVRMPSVIPTLVPGQEWRTSWDLRHIRLETDLPKEYTIKVSYQGIGSKRQEETYVLDWDTYYQNGYLGTRTIHHVAKRLEEMLGLMKTGLPVAGPVRVRWSRKPTRVEEWWAQKRHERWERMVLKKNPQLEQQMRPDESESSEE